MVQALLMVQGHRNGNGQGRAFVPGAEDGALSAHHEGSFPDPDQPECFFVTGGLHIESFSVVGDFQDQVVVYQLQAGLDLFCIGMACDIGQGFLVYPE